MNQQIFWALILTFFRIGGAGAEQEIKEGKFNSNITTTEPYYGEYYEHLKKTISFNFFTRTSLTPHPTKADGTRFDRIAYEDIKLNISSIHFTMLLYFLPSIFIFIHLTRRYPINHNYKVRYYTLVGDPAKQIKHFEKMRSERLSAEEAGDSASYFYQLWTNNISTSKKLLQAFENDFDIAYCDKTPEEYQKTRKGVVELISLQRDFLEDDDL